jgi:hypothetical protein
MAIVENHKCRNEIMMRDEIKLYVDVFGANLFAKFIVRHERYISTMFIDLFSAHTHSTTHDSTLKGDF